MDLRLYSWNVRSLYKPGALKTVLEQIDNYKADITAIQEMRWTGTKILEKANHTIFYSCHHKDHILGTGFIVNKTIRENVVDFQAKSPRLCKLRLKSQFFRYSIINAHAPTEEKLEEEKDEFYLELETMVQSCPKNDIKIIIGDLNAKVGQEAQYTPTIGKHSLHIESNDNGFRLIQFAASQNMVIGGSCFEHKQIHKATWISPDQKTTNQIDHLLIDSRHFSNVMDVRSRRGANIDSDHYLLETKLRARISNAKKKSGRKRERYCLDKLKNEIEMEKYKKEIEGEFVKFTDPPDTNIDHYWQKCKEKILEAANKTIGKQNGQQRDQNWFDEECAEITRRKNVIYSKLQQRKKTRGLSEEYKQLRREEKTIHRKKKREYTRMKMQDLETLRSQSEVKKFYKEINRSRKEFKPRTNMCRNKEGDIISNREDVLKRWAENFEEKLNPRREGEEEYDNFIDSGRGENDNREKESPSIEEVITSIERLKNNKSPGYDELPAELIKNGGEKVCEKLHILISEIWKRTIIPKEWNIGVLVPLHKKGDQLDCESYRGITLLNIAYKVLANILYERLRPYAEAIIGKYQCGFCKNKSTTDQIFLLRQILEKSYEYNMETHHLFVDFKSAYDTVNRNALYKAMEDFNIPPHLIALTRLTLAQVECRVRVQNDLSRSFTTQQGLRQGDPLSTILFNLALERVIRKAEIYSRGTIINRSLQILAFADDVDIIAKSKRNMIQAFTALERAAKAIGLEINANKTKYMEAGKKTRLPQEHQILTIDTHNIEKVSEFIYLGSKVTSNNDTSLEIKRRVYLANKAYYGLQKHLKSDLVSRNTKCLIYKTLIRPVLMYASETWTMTQNDERILGVFERKILRHIYGGIKENGEWRRRYNFELYSKYEEPDITTKIKIGRLRWIGHVQRMQDTDPIKQIIRQVPVGTRSQGKPKTRYMDQIDKDLQALKINNWKMKARNREEWRKLLRQVKTL